MIRTDRLHMHFGGIRAVNGVSLEIPRGRITGLIGPNGAGKTTFFNVVAGHHKPTAGRVYLDGEDVTGLTAHELFARGLLRTFQIAHEFSTLTVRENLEMGAYLCPHNIEARIEHLAGLFPILQERSRQPAGELSGGQRQQVAVARAMMTQPRVLMLDEPTAGVSPILVQELFAKIQEIASAGIAVLIVEQNARQALSLADKGFVLVQGKNRFTGTGQDLLDDPDVRQSFLGG
ncbi:MAG TPA: ABC transporter ATP-binding protein [Synechococcus sp. UBA8638]|nr:ABC transporter ATP-binding protein [Synechococcus sp. UBA8638]